jgi:putative membrane protein
MELLDAILAFGKHMVTALAFMVVFVIVFVRLTPHREFELIRAGNGAAATGLIGAAIGFAIALSQSIKVSSNLLEAATWAGIAMLAQLLGQFIAQWIFPKIYTAVEEDNVAAGIVKGGTGVVIGLINAACMTP